LIPSLGLGWRGVAVTRRWADNRSRDNEIYESPAACEGHYRCCRWRETQPCAGLPSLAQRISSSMYRTVARGNLLPVFKFSLAKDEEARARN
jgi:hypothetical protein